MTSNALYRTDNPLGPLIDSPAVESEPKPHFVPVCSICGKPCLLEECVIDANGLAVHKEC
jgi:hypothetical protein